MLCIVAHTEIITCIYYIHCNNKREPRERGMSQGTRGKISNFSAIFRESDDKEDFFSLKYMRGAVTL